MSYDLIFWRGRPTQPPTEVWNALYEKEPVNFVMQLAFADVLAAFRTIYGADLQVETAERRISGRGWEFGMEEGDYYLHVTCSWALAEDEVAIKKLQQAGRAAGCSMFDPQTYQYFEAPALIERPKRVTATPVAPSTPAWPCIGARVAHARFGEGVIASITGEGDTAKVRVMFADGEKVLIARVLSPA